MFFLALCYGPYGSLYAESGIVIYPKQMNYIFFLSLVIDFKCIQEPVAVTTTIQEEIFTEMGVGE